MIYTVISLLACVGIPLAGAAYFVKRRDGTFLTFVVGAVCFYVSQPLLRIPLVGLAGRELQWFSLLPYTSIVGYYLILGFTAGLFEECARWLGFRIFRKGRVSWMDGLAFGLGHGGCEAAWLFFVQVLPLAGGGHAGPSLLIGAWERIFTMMVHIGLTFVVLYGIKTRRLRYLGLAILLHGLVDFSLILGNVWLLEAMITAEGILSLILVLRARRNWDKKTQQGGNPYEKI